MSERYHVLGINQSNRNLTIAGSDLRSNRCPRYLVNPNFDRTLFSFTSNNENHTLSYDCTSEINSIFNFSCEINGTTRDYFFAIERAPGNYSIQDICRSSVVVPVLRTAPRLATLGEVLMKGFELEYGLPYNDACVECVISYGKCGFNSTCRGHTCFCSDGPYPVMCPKATPGSNGSKALIGIVSSVIAAVVLGVLILIGIYRHKLCFNCKKEGDQNVELFFESYESQAPRRYKYSDLKKMTNSFKEKLGQGGFGSVFKGKLFDGCPVAVKVLNESKGTGEEFINEVATISRTNHLNIVSLFGFCFEGSKRALIYEFMANGSLEKFIYDRKASVGHPLGWEKLHQIAVGIARGLEYLHRGCNTRILHFDIKPHNILLDENFCPKISDFGMAKLYSTRESMVSVAGARGTTGYIAPEVFCRNFGGVSYKSDVYSYRMMLLEMVGGRKNIDTRVENISEIYFPHWIYKKLEEQGLARIEGFAEIIEEEVARKMILVGLWCIQTDPKNRPSMGKVVELLEGNNGSLVMPPNPFCNQISDSMSSPPRS